MVFLTTPTLLTGQAIKWKETCLTTSEFDNRYASYSPDGKWIVFETNRDANWEIYVMDSQGKNLRRLTKDKADDRRPSWHPNGRKILFESNRDSAYAIYEMRIRSLKVKKMVDAPVGAQLVFASYGPQGQGIGAALKISDEESNIVMYRTKYPQLETLIKNGKRNTYPRFSPNGDEVLYFSRQDTENVDDEIYVFNMKTKQNRRLTHWPTHNFCPAWSADGTQVVYVTSMEEVRPELYIMDDTGGNPTRITYNKDGDTLPNWHPSEEKILFTGYRGGSFQICELYIHERPSK